MDTAIIVGVIVGSVVAMVLVFAKTVLGVAWTGKSARRVGISETSNQNGVTQEYLANSNNPGKELRSSEVTSEKAVDVKKADTIGSLINKQLSTCDNVTIGNIHTVHNGMMVIESLPQDRTYEIPTYYVRQNLHNNVLVDICASDLEHYKPHVI